MSGNASTSAGEIEVRGVMPLNGEYGWWIKTGRKNIVKKKISYRGMVALAHYPFSLTIVTTGLTARIGDIQWIGVGTA